MKYNSRLSRAIHELQTSYTRSTDVPYQSNTSSFASYLRSVRNLSVGLAINQSGSRATRERLVRKKSGSRGITVDTASIKRPAPILIIFSVYDIFNRAALRQFLQFLLLLLHYYTMPQKGRKPKGKGSKVPAKEDTEADTRSVIIFQ